MQMQNGSLNFHTVKRFEFQNSRPPFKNLLNHHFLQLFDRFWWNLPSERNVRLKYLIFQNLIWQTAAIWKSKNCFNIFWNYTMMLYSNLANKTANITIKCSLWLMLMVTDQKLQKSLERWYYSASNWHSSDMMVGNITVLMIFVVFDPLLLTLWINCSY